MCQLRSWELFYSVIDMLETALNVWSDSCVVKVVDEHVKALNVE